MTTAEFTLFILGVSILISGIIIFYAMIREYQNYLDDHWKAEFSLADFIKREQFYIYLFLGLTLIILQSLWYLLSD